MSEITSGLLRPSLDRVLIKPTAPKEKEGAIFIPEINREKQNEGVVVAVGSGRPMKKGGLSPVDVKVGDKVIFHTYTAQELNWNGEYYRLAERQDLLCIVE